MSESITVRGYAGNKPEVRMTNNGTEVATFRVASTPRWRNSTTGDWASGETNWYSVAAFGNFANNVAESISKGDPVVVVGRPKIRTWEGKEGGTGTEVEINAQTVGHDLKYGRSSFAKVNREPQTRQTETEQVDTETGEITGLPVQDQPADPRWEGEPDLERQAA
ncbi:single-stranded DNA-binding protein [Nesterenkonia ebinurensis]|uniref:single-stranded DNA-binding protein n=1 Tax=Nesterenkonia ebinurensis TaxID=2608252 RepID=UPI00123C7AD4|nr:single-stranded DNA-binding protein [Nesterenkonia ebinurensis]